MSPFVVILLLLAGLSEAVGRVLPVVAARSGVSRTRAIGLITAGAVVEAAVFALWPLSAWAVAMLILPPGTEDGAALVWSPGLVAPLLLAAVLAFPLLGPFLHLALFVGVGAGLTTALAPLVGLGWWTAAGCVAVAGVGLGVTVEVVRRLAAWLNTAPAREALTWPA
ncbi:hypothetical protein Ais01nite_79820 [Asanoa ishikariensis]|uniref:Integral membrane protein n=1 Tax=Asanoa ishikariensis TaxID=137265 RepID=A0A1H3UNX2_9ACTN|nr:hypothetical protein [Asanoa ishikariensis]GIF69947.1 hypothetical protein Ais01nite_79820 [Asanoa ishikariensis]SDZ63419.1 hypothetical protein SAMN05421684_7510 [Asanoa ishikariensis]